jgi:ankyrin repeat protein
VLDTVKRRTTRRARETERAGNAAGLRATPLCKAAVAGEAHRVSALLRDMQTSKLVFERDNNARTMLSLVSERGHTRVAKSLLQRRADVNSVDGASRSPLMYAVANNHYDSTLCNAM